MNTAISYDPVAWFYEKLAHIYSLGRIRAAKLSQLQHLRPGDRVLYVGVGAGEDAIAAAKMGCHVSCLDLSPKMLARARRRFELAGVRADFICADVMTYVPEAPFDAVAANFFFNIFARDTLGPVVARVASFVTSRGGRLMIADFSPAQGGFIARSVQQGFWRTSVIFWRVLKLSALHPLHDYGEFLPAWGFELESLDHFPIFAWAGAPSYSSWVARPRSGAP